MAKITYILGVLIFVILTSSVYFMLPDSVRIDVGMTYSTFNVWENDKWVLAGQEYTLLFDGTKKMRASSRTVEEFIDGNIATIVRTANFKNNVTAIDTYVFDANEANVEMFPISHDINVLNGEGYILVYEVTKLQYFGETIKGIQSPQSFGHKMKVEWEEGNYYSRIYKYFYRDEGKLTVKYRPDSANFTKKVRLFDPPSNITVTLNDPEDNNFSAVDNVYFNCSADISGDTFLENLSLWTNATGVWNMSRLTENIKNSTLSTVAENSITVTKSTGALTLMKTITLLPDYVTQIEDQTRSDQFLTTKCQWIYYYMDGTTAQENESCGGDTTWTNEVWVNTKPNSTVERVELWMSRDAGDSGNPQERNSVVKGYNTLQSLSIIINQTITNTTVWNCMACDNSSNCNFSENNYTVVYDLYTPVIIFSGDTQSNGTFISQDYVFAEVTIDRCDGFKNKTFDIYNDTLFNSTTTTEDCRKSDHNWTNILDDIYYYNVTTCTLLDICNSTETRQITLDTTFPLIDYTANSDETNITANFSIKDWIFINVTVVETNEQNITFSLYTSENGYLEDVFTNSTRTINYTNLPEDMYFWNVTVCDIVNHCNTTEVRNYGVETTNMSIELTFSNIFSELGNEIFVNATNTLDMVYVDIDHPDYGVNYSSGKWETTFNLLIDYFRKDYFNDSSASKILNYIGEQIKTVYFSSHQYDEVYNMSINISGTNQSQYPENVVVYKANTTDIDRIFPGFLMGNLIHLNRSTTAEINSTLFFNSLSPQSIEFYMDDGATFNEFVFNITGIEFGFEYVDEFNDSSILDTVLNEGMFRGGFGIPIGNNLKAFVYDAFTPNGAIDSDLWTVLASGSYSGSGDGYDAVVANTYSSSKLELDTKMDEDAQGGISRTFNNYAYPNWTLFNIWSAQEIEFDVEFNTDAERIDSSGTCNIFLSGDIGTVNFWTSQWDVCSRSGTIDCIVESETTDLHFELVRNVNNSWNLTRSGSETTSGNGIEQGDCGTYSFVYNYSSGTLTKTVSTPGGACSIPNSPNVTTLNNFSIINGLEWDTVLQIKFNSQLSGTFAIVPDKGCDDMDSVFKISNLNYSLYNLTNSSIISNSVYDSAGEISDATLNADSFNPGLKGTITPYLSSNDGEDWEGVTDGVEHSFDDPGVNMRYKYDFVFEEGYATQFPLLLDMNITTPTGYPENISFDFGNDGTIDATYDGELNTTNSPATITINSSILTGVFSEDADNESFPHLYEVPLTIISEGVGELLLDEFNLTYNPNPVSLDLDSIIAFLALSLGFVDFPISIESISGNISIDDIGYDYAGGNSTIEVLAHNADYSQNVSRNITYFYSSFEKVLPYTWVDVIFFRPQTNSSKNVSAYGQTSTTPIYNLTTTNYGGDMNLSIKLNESFSCLNITWNSTGNTKPSGNKLNTTYQEIVTNVEYLNNTQIWLWADFENCNASEQRVLSPYLFVEGYCVDCVWF